MVVELAVHEGEPRRDARRNARRARERDEQLRVLVAVAAARAQRLQRTRHADVIDFCQRVVHPLVDALGHDARIRLVAAEAVRQRDDLGVLDLEQRLGHRGRRHHRRLGAVRQPYVALSASGASRVIVSVSPRSRCR